MTRRTRRKQEAGDPDLIPSDSTSCNYMYSQSDPLDEGKPRMYITEQPPTCDTSDAEMAMQVRFYSSELAVPGSFIISGPTLGGNSRGQFYGNAKAALSAAIKRYGGYAKVTNGRIEVPGVHGIVTAAKLGKKWAIRVSTAASLANQEKN